MKKFIFIAFILLLAAITNPTIDEYAQWGTQSMKINTNNSNIIEAATNFGISLVGPTLIEKTTKAKNLIFFTVFTTSSGFSDDVVVIGMFRTFIPIYGTL